MPKVNVPPPRLSGDKVRPRKPAKPHRFRPGTVALREIKKLQKSTNLLMRRLPFQRLIRVTAHKFAGRDGVRMSAVSLLLLQEATEAMIIGVFENANRLARHAGRITLMSKDIGLARQSCQMRGCKAVALE